MNTVEKMRQRLAALEPENLEILDESAQHAGHEGAKGGGGHYRLTIVSRQFAGISTLARQRMIYNILGNLMHEDIHALGIKAYTPEEPVS